MEDEQVDRLIGIIRAHDFILSVVVATILSRDKDPIAGARDLRDTFADKFADAPPVGGAMPHERQAKINHYSAHFAETFWKRVEQMVSARKTS